MVIFEDIQDAEEWIDPMGYIEFWDAMAPYNIFSIAERDHCDGLIAGGKVRQDLILDVIKGIARRGLIDRFGLTHRRHITHTTQGLASLH